jgi:hypothetical protein
MVKHSNIDKATYDFWRTWEFSYQSVGNPFSTPGIVLGNISNGGAGIFLRICIAIQNVDYPQITVVCVKPKTKNCKGLIFLFV